MKTRLLMLAVVFWMGWARAAGLIWPAGQLLPAFSPPVPVLDCIDVSSASSAEIDLFASLEGLVNRTQPQIICVSSANGEGAYTWLILHNQAYVITNGYSALLQFRTNVTGLVVTDPNLADTLNLATTMAGVNNELICNPSLLATLTNAPYSLTWSNAPAGAKSVVAQACYGTSWVAVSPAVNFTVGAPVVAKLAPQGTNLVLSWTGGTANFQVQVATNLTGAAWQNYGTAGPNTSITINRTNRAAFYRVQWP